MLLKIITKNCLFKVKNCCNHVFICVMLLWSAKIIFHTIICFPFLLVIYGIYMAWDCIQWESWCMGPTAGVDYNLTLCWLQSRLQSNTCTMGNPICHKRPSPYARVNFIPRSGTKNMASDLTQSRLMWRAKDKWERRLLPQHSKERTTFVLFSSCSTRENCTGLYSCNKVLYTVCIH
jgi:hypothetical protein